MSLPADVARRGSLGWRWLRTTIPLMAVLTLCAVTPAHAQPGTESLSLVKRAFPEAEALRPLDGAPPAAGIYAGERLLGYAFLTDDIAPIPAYSGRPISALATLDLDGMFGSVDIVRHEEPILVVGITGADLERFTRQYAGLRASQRIKIGGAPREGYATVDGISGATITVMVLNRSLVDAVRQVAAAHAPAPPVAAQPIARAAAPIPGPADAIDAPIWREAWAAKRLHIVVLALGLIALTCILVFQDWLARHPTFLTRVRTAFLLFTLFYIGWFTLAQLSIVNVLTFVHALAGGFSWDTFLIEPLMFILWSFVAITIVLWGRGVYCGWLCPFGALQELVFKLARLLGLPAREFPQAVHDRLLAIKYVIVIVLFGLSMGSLATAVRFAEVEPFKTAITLRFDREAPYVAFAAVLILISCVNRKFYCRYLCPLGAALTFPGRFRIFSWLRRRKECGRPCQTCAAECEVRAIGPTGEINDNECHYCLDCQVTYWNAYRCPPLVERRKRRERIDVRVVPPGSVVAPSGEDSGSMSG